MKLPSSDVSPWNLAGQRGLSSIELLVSCALVAVLSTLGGAIYSSASQKGAMVKEVSAAKTLTSAFMSYALDHNGVFMQGFNNRAEAIQLPNGAQLGSEVTSRYPFRLAPYFEHQLEGTIFVNKNKAQIDKVFSSRENYGASLCPALGMNTLFVGGYFFDDKQTYPDECASRQAQMSSSLLLFASAGFQTGGVKVDGYFTISAPYNTATDNNWGARANQWTSASAASDYGNVDARYGGKAVCAFLDGSVKMLSIVELKDMRLWNKNAVTQDLPEYTVTPPVTGGGRPR